MYTHDTKRPEEREVYHSVALFSETIKLRAFSDPESHAQRSQHMEGEELANK